MWRNFRCLPMTDVEKSEILHIWHLNISTCGVISNLYNSNVYNCWGFIAIYAVLLLNLLFTLFCREIYFATIYALSCGEKLSPKVHLWRKMTNIRSVQQLRDFNICRWRFLHTFPPSKINVQTRLKKKEGSFVFWDLSNLGNCLSPDILPSRLAIVSPMKSTKMKVKIERNHLRWICLASWIVISEHEIHEDEGKKELFLKFILFGSGGIRKWGSLFWQKCYLIVFSFHFYNFSML